MGAASGATIDHPLGIATVRDKWGWILALGVTLVLCGLMAITLPTLTETTVSTTLGGALIVIGVVKIVETFKLKEWGSFQWQMIPGVVEVAGGIMIYASPSKWAVAVSLLAAIVFAVQGVAQVGLAFKVRPQPGWTWLMAAGVVALSASAVLVMKFPHIMREYPPSTIAGISLFIAGFAYIVIAFVVRRSGKPV
jgi:uncharacterized membrane protein HdeD (DUF308 family)